MPKPKHRAFLKTLLLCTIAGGVSSCALGTKVSHVVSKTFKNEKSHDDKRDNKTRDEAKSARSVTPHIVNSGQKTNHPPPLVLPLRTARAMETPYAPVPKSNFPYDSEYSFAPIAKDIGENIKPDKTPNNTDEFPIALRRASPAQTPYSPVIRAEKAKSEISAASKTLALAPITINGERPKIANAPARANTLPHNNPSLIEKGYFDRPLKTYQLLTRPIAEPIKPGVETLRQAIAQSYKTDPRLAAERTRVKETDESYIQARAEGRPNASASGQIDYAFRRAPTSSSPFGGGGRLATESGHPRDGQVQITQPLYQGGRIRALKDQAKSGIMAARERLRDAEQSTALSAATVYVDLIRDRAIADVRREDLRLVMRQEQAAKDRFEIGVGTMTDVYQAKTRVSGAEISLAEANAQLAISLAAYDRIIGYPPLSLAPIPDMNIPKTAKDAIQIARNNNPRFRAAARDFDTAFAAIKIADAAGSPTVALTGTATAERGQFTGLDRRDALALALQLRIPLYSGGGNSSRKRQATATKDRLYFEVLDTERAVEQIIHELWAAHKAAKRSHAEAQSQTRFAQTAYDGVKQEQLFGQRNVLDVLNAEREWQNAKAQEAAAKRNIHIAAFRLLNTMGVFDAKHLALPVAIYDPSENLNAIATSKYTKRKPKVIIDDWEDAIPPTELPPAPPF